MAYAKKKMSKVEAKNKAINYGIDFSINPYKLSNDEKWYLNNLAKQTGYRGSRAGVSSIWLQFFNHLQKH